ncbi:acyl-CoA dehydrogenase [Streptosporangiaceae bacterium NEAU-GS5]|nr:acyl-CoA dehydrogenase [Streptosporangiaceae bacterium NEAU-GS5]
MGIGLTPEHAHLAATIAARGIHPPHAAPQAPADRPGFWRGLADQGILGIHLPEEHGGQGFGLLELAVATEALGAACAPGPFLPTVLASAVIAAGSDADRHKGLLSGLADGSLTAAVALPFGSRTALGSPEADVFVLAGPKGWMALERAQVTAEALDSLDLTRGLLNLVATAVPDDEETAPHERTLSGVTDATVGDLAAVLLSAEACGIAAWAVGAAADHAKLREQFGRPIGQFQGVKHKCAAMLVALEQARAAVWDAARSLDPIAVAAAAVLAPDAAVRCAADAIQVLGGIGYTFDHDAHLYYRRALTLRGLLGDGGPWAAGLARLALSGARRVLEPDLPAEAVPIREEIRATAASLAAEEPLTRLRRLADEGWMMPHLPRPWGRGASPLEQVIIQQEFRELRRPNLAIAAWAVPSIVRYGTAEQRERFLPKTFTGEIAWCQLFSEPGAGSDLAALTTRAVRADGGWLITGQKIWTSLAQYAHWAICLARTDPDASKHEGITYFLVDMAAPGVQVRPLKEINGDEIFNQVFLDDVFVPDDMVVGEVNQGWRVARDTLSHERVALGESWGPGAQHQDMLTALRKAGPREAQLEAAGRLYAEGHAIAALGLRITLSQLSGLDPGTASSVRKLLGMRHAQAISEFCWSLDPLDPHWSRMILTTRAFTIGGGTTEIQLNIIAERALALPRDP